MHKINVRAIKRCLKWRKEYQEHMDKKYDFDFVFFKGKASSQAALFVNVYEWVFTDVFRKKCATIE